MAGAASRATRAALGVVLLATLGGACRRPVRAAPLTAALPPVHEGHCWWAVFRTALPPDTVTARFANAFVTLGLGGVTRASQADTAWVYASPTALGATAGAAPPAVAGDGPAAGTYAARVVAFRRGDSTLYRHFVAVGPPPGETPPDSAGTTRRHIGLCAALGRAAGVGGTAPRDPDGEERRPVWARGREGGSR